MKDKIRKLVKSLGVTPDLKGYNYIISAIEIICKNNIDCKVSKDVYPVVARMYGSTPSRVERSIRHCVGKLFDSYESIDLLMSTLDCNLETDHLTNSQFLFLCADTILHDSLKDLR